MLTVVITHTMYDTSIVLAVELYHATCSIGHTVYRSGSFDTVGRQVAS